MTNITPANQVADRARRVVRTVVQVGIPAFLGLAVVLPEIMAAVVQDIPETNQIRLVLLGAAAVVTATAAAITRVMMIPAVNSWLQGLNLSAPTVAEVDPNSVNAPDPGVVEDVYHGE